MAIPQALGSVDRSRGLAAVRYLAGRMALARSQAVSRSATVALRFAEEAVDTSFAVYVDGNRNGIRTRDIEAGIDRQIAPLLRLSDLFPGVTIGLAPDTPAASAVQVGGSGILSFTSSGTATAGSVHVLGRDGTQWAVRVLGATGRTRILRYDRTRSQWVER